MEANKYYKYIDFMRLLSCISVLLYHLGLLNGGYLAVCIFFVLSGYLSCVSAFKKEKFSIFSYYYNKLLRIYVPVVIFAFITVAIISLFPSINWFNLKPEVRSVIFGYNNFWQLNANLDYFARHSTSPFIHLWYISILLQFELVFPFIYIILHKLGNKFNKLVPCIISTTFSIAACLYFFVSCTKTNIMTIYYGTFFRSFSFLFGISLGFINSYYGSVISKKINNKIINKLLLIVCIALSLYLLVFIKFDSRYFSLAMIIITIITCVLIDYSISNCNDKLSFFDKTVKQLSSISYEIYLFQYPIIFLFQYININYTMKIVLILILTIVVSYIFNFCLNNKNKKIKIIQYLCLTIILLVASFGVYKYIISKDHTKEMQLLEKQLAENEKMIDKSNEKYLELIKQEEIDWNKVLDEYEKGEAKLGEIVNKLSIVGIGDSVMLGAIQTLHSRFPNGYFDAKVSRTDWEANPILKDLINKNILGDPIIIGLGTNGGCTNSCKTEIMKTCGNRKVFWINTTNYDYINNDLITLSKKYENLHVIDWKSASSGHKEYFVSDGIHLTSSGRKAYTDTIYNSIYQVYLNEYNKKRQEALQEHENKIKNKITFYGNQVLLNAFNYIQEEFQDSKFIADKKLDYKRIKSEITKSIDNKSLTNKIIFIVDSTIDITLNEYKELFGLCDDCEVYVLSTDKSISEELEKSSIKNIKILKFYDEIEKNKNYLSSDGIHLSKEGNKALSTFIKEKIQ